MATYGFPDAIAKFEKVSKETWMNSMPSAFKEDEKDDIKLSAEKRELREKYEKSYEEIQLPSRATAGSAGYDFFLPFSRITLFPMDTITIPTGIKCQISKPYMLQLYPRSSHGIKNRISLSNTVGIIDGDYYNNESNEGHIMVALRNNHTVEGVPIKRVINPITNQESVTIDMESSAFKSRVFIIDPGTAFCQGIFVPYGLTVDDSPRSNIRTGGIGSTTEDKKSSEN